ncbi:MAG: hypothetical protein LIR50_16060 [Bacillota bacterium]|nr:hypothetical protein [Bacillota bacterium]
MKDNLKPQFTWDEESGVATCILTDGKEVYIGVAKCCDIDRDMMNEKTGCEIALKRATINYYKSVRNHELIPSLNTLKGIEFTLKTGNYDSKSLSVIQKKINKIQQDLDIIKYLLIEQKESLTEYISAKDDFYKQVRKNREKKDKIK